MNAFLTSLATGIGQGSVYALIAVSFVIIFRATGVLNFAQPALLILGAFATSVFAVDLGLPFFVAVLLAVIVVAALATVLERIAIRPMVGRPRSQQRSSRWDCSSSSSSSLSDCSTPSHARSVTPGS